jgi:hypothetical protein
MPNHFHAILYFPKTGYDLNKIIGNGKRLIAYEIIERLCYSMQLKTIKPFVNTKGFPLLTSTFVEGGFQVNNL